MKKVFGFMAVCSGMMLILGGSCATAEPVSGDDNPHIMFIDKADLSKLKMPKKMPEGYPGLSNCVYRKGGVIEVSDDVEETILKREQIYSFQWMFGAGSDDLWRHMGQLGLECIPSGKILPSRRFNGKDDVMFIHYQTIYDVGRRYDVQIVDWRDLSILVTSADIRTSSIEEIVKRFLRTDSLFCGGSTKYTSISKEDLGEGRTCGKIELQYKMDKEPFSNPVEWYKDGDSILFVLVKERMPQWLRVGEDAGRNWYAGMAYNDPRSFLRFENSNRIEVAEEYAKAKREKRKK